MDNLERITADPAYRQLSRERRQLGVCLSAAMAAAYFSYIFVVAFRPDALGVPIGPSTVMTWGLLAGVGVIAFGFVLTALYVAYANARFDALTLRVKEALQ